MEEQQILILLYNSERITEIKLSFKMEKERTKHDISDVESFHEILPGKEHLKNEMDNDYVTYSHAA